MKTRKILAALLLVTTNYQAYALNELKNEVNCVVPDGPVSMAALCIENTFRASCSKDNWPAICVTLEPLRGSAMRISADVTEGRISESQGRQKLLAARDEALQTAGIAPVQAAPAASSGTAASATVDPLISCYSQVANDPLFSEIAGKLPLTDLTAVTFAMLTDTTKPSALERRELAEWFRRHDECWATSEAQHLAEWPPEVFQLAKERNAGAQAVGIELYSRKITYGEANKKLEDLGNSIKARMVPIVRQYQEQVAAQMAARKA